MQQTKQTDRSRPQTMRAASTTTAMLALGGIFGATCAHAALNPQNDAQTISFGVSNVAINVLANDNLTSLGDGTFNAEITNVTPVGTVKGNANINATKTGLQYTSPASGTSGDKAEFDYTIQTKSITFGSIKVTDTGPTGTGSTETTVAPTISSQLTPSSGQQAVVLSPDTLTTQPYIGMIVTPKLPTTGTQLPAHCTGAQYKVTVSWDAYKFSGGSANQEVGIAFGTSGSVPLASAAQWQQSNISAGSNVSIIRNYTYNNAGSASITSVGDIRIGFFAANAQPDTLTGKTSEFKWASIKASIDIEPDTTGCAQETGQARLTITLSNDFDGDGDPDVTDPDDDNDGIPDTTEGDTAVDTDGDGQPDSRDTDADGDGILDQVERGPDCPTLANCTPTDTDGDGKPDYRDLDSDGDGIGDTTEAGGTYDPNKKQQDPISSPRDSDADSVPNHLDLDADNDGISDVLEDRGTDANGDGKADNGSITQTPKDKDGDKVPNYLDLDSDNDGLPDLVEGNCGVSGSSYVCAPNLNQIASTTARIASPIDTTAKNGWDDRHQGKKEVDLPNADGTDDPDFLDINSDNDAQNDTIETGRHNNDRNKDGIIDGTPNADGWFPNLPSPIASLANGAVSAQGLPDGDKDGIPAYVDANDVYDPTATTPVTPVTPTPNDDPSTPVIKTGLQGHGATGPFALLMAALVGLLRLRRRKA